MTLNEILQTMGDAGSHLVIQQTSGENQATEIISRAMDELVEQSAEKDALYRALNDLFMACSRLTIESMDDLSAEIEQASKALSEYSALRPEDL